MWALSVLCRQQRAAVCIQRRWRGHTTRRRYLLHRRRVVRLQCLWRAKLARRELRKRRASQREAGKLLQVRLRLSMHGEIDQDGAGRGQCCWARDGLASCYRLAPATVSIAALLLCPLNQSAAEERCWLRVPLQLVGGWQAASGDLLFSPM